MADFYKIVIDTEGSDKGPEMIIRGVAMALAAYPKLAVLLVGKEELVRAECERCGIETGERVEILDARDAITNYDSPAAAVFGKPESTLVKALTALSERDDLKGIINAGSTGALIAGAVRHLSTPERTRPALSAILPSEGGGFTCLVDTGATIDCTPEMLVHFAKLGSAFMKQYYAIENPRIGLLSNGAEPTKGNKVVKEAHALLAGESELNFIGNVEGTGALSGSSDVLVCDGFAGNQVLKVTEGIARRIITDIVKYSKKTGDESIMKLVGYLMGIYDFNSLGGGILLGTRKPVIKAHGAANEKSIASCIGIMLNMLENKAIFDEGALLVK